MNHVKLGHDLVHKTQALLISNGNPYNSGSASGKAQQVEPVVGQDDSGGSGIGAVIVLSAAGGLDVPVTEARNADGREMGDGIPTQSSALGGASYLWLLFMNNLSCLLGLKDFKMILRVTTAQWDQQFYIEAESLIICLIINFVLLFYDSVTTAATTITTDVASTRPKAKGIIFHDQEEQASAFTPIVSSSQLPQAKDKGKGKMVEPEKPLKKKDQIALDEELALRLQAEEQVELEKERVAHQEAIREAVIEELDSIHAMIDADEELAAKLQAEEQEQFSIEENSRMLVEMIVERKKFFAAQRAAKQKRRSYEEIQKLFDRAYKQVSSFVPMDSEVVKSSVTRTEGSSKRAGDELESNKSNKQKIDEIIIAVILEYLVKISKKAHILKLKQRHLKITVLTSNTPYRSRKIRRICARTSLKTKKDQDPIRRSWSDSGEENEENDKDETCLMAQASSEVNFVGLTNRKLPRHKNDVEMVNTRWGGVGRDGRRI
ncbi:hypothetical protein Tco_0751326 [Tanacetum coccineum]|uniref:Uncharacterized protein n=1 Tax=Tanacetum coccineum TaxID=301880 RepID=A0ABQ4Z4Q5_9ASTR